MAERHEKAARVDDLELRRCRRVNSLAESGSNTRVPDAPESLNRQMQAIIR